MHTEYFPLGGNTIAEITYSYQPVEGWAVIRQKYNDACDTAFAKDGSFDNAVFPEFYLETALVEEVKFIQSEYKKQACTLDAAQYKHLAAAMREIEMKPPVKCSYNDLEW